VILYIPQYDVTSDTDNELVQVQNNRGIEPVMMMLWLCLCSNGSVEAAHVLERNPPVVTNLIQLINQLII
jgi:hypothetical protein